MNAEYKRRATSRSANIGVPRSHSTFCVSLQYKQQDSVENPVLKIEKYDHKLNRLKEIVKLPQRNFFGIVLHKNKAYVLGGWENNKSLRTVSHVANQK